MNDRDNSYEKKDTSEIQSSNAIYQSYSDYYTEQKINNEASSFSSPEDKKAVDNFGNISLSLSLAFIYIALIGCCCLSPLAFFMAVAIPVCEIAAIFFAFFSRKKMGRFTGIAISGIVISSVALLFIVLLLVMMLLLYISDPVLFKNLDRLFTEPEFYKEFIPEHYPDYYNKNAEEIDELFEKYFKQYNDIVGGTVIK